MARVEYNGIWFDSEWEKDFYIHIQTNVTKCIWRNNLKPFTNLIARKHYTPDMIYLAGNTFHIVEVKGSYNPFANHFQDEMIHKEMKAKTQEELRHYVESCGIATHFDETFVYEKVKKLKSGWVDFDFKNPNTLANKRKEKINDLSAELKELKEFKKNAMRYFSYRFKVGKLTKKQLDFYMTYQENIKKELERK